MAYGKKKPKPKPKKKKKKPKKYATVFTNSIGNPWHSKGE
tara:strand:- start:2872 stop:2991 length:120 start_codon:yes stop_codon:yes gene_type:complete